MNDEFNKNVNDENESSYEMLLKKYSTDSVQEQEAVPVSAPSEVKKFTVHISDDEFGESVPAQKEKKPKAAFKLDKASFKNGDFKKKVACLLGAFKQYRAEKKAAKDPEQTVEKDFRRTFIKISRKLKINLTAVIVIFISAVLVCSTLLSIYIMSCANDVLAIKNSTEIVTVTIPEDASTTQIVKILKQNGLIKHRVFCTVFAGIRFFGDDYLNGIYYVNSKMGLEGMIRQFQETPTSAQTVTLTFPEGWTVEQIIDRLDEADVCDKEILYKTLNEVSFDYDFLKDIPDTIGRYSKYEGYLYPDTYDFYIGENANSVLKRFFDNFQNKMLDTYKDRAKELGMSIDDVVKLASIIQKEAKDSEQMPAISSVLHNRLYKYHSDIPNLGCDSTTYYYNTYVMPNINAVDRETYSTAYNTYVIETLPAGAICNPGIDAIYAALYPEDSNNLYFCHDGKGNLYLAKTIEQHNKNYTNILQGKTKSSD